MKAGEYVYARTHAELLNELLGTNYKAYMKCAKKLPNHKLLGMIELGNFITPAGWINKFKTRYSEISEKHVGDKFAYAEHDTYINSILYGGNFDDSDRVVFEIIKGGNMRKYIFRGVFRINAEKSTAEENIWDLISEEYTL